MTLNRGSFPLKNHEVEALQLALGVIPEDIEGQKFCDVVRRKTIERRRLSLIKQPDLPGQSESLDLWKMCRFRAINGDFIPVGWALRSKVTGDYFVYAEVW